jgi:hypothetical protein
MMSATAAAVFRRCVEVIRAGELIVRETEKDKEFHFQNWFQTRLVESKLLYDQGGRNSYPDFKLVKQTEGFEIKGLAYPGRDANFDSNSQVPTGLHNGRTIYYVFGRYPKKPDGNRYPVVDLVLCHGDFLNADHEYEHRNKNVKGFGSYGDLMIRDRKMYVVPTPFHLVNGVAHQCTLILPYKAKPGKGFEEVGRLVRTESAELIVGYSFDLRTNSLVPEKIKNPGAGTSHDFRAWRLSGSPVSPASMNNVSLDELAPELDDEEGDH